MTFTVGAIVCLLGVILGFMAGVICGAAANEHARSKAEKEDLDG